MIVRMNESKTLTKHISWKSKCKFDEKIVIQVNGGIMINVDVSVENVMYVKKILLGTLLHVIVQMENIQQVLLMIQQLCVIKLQNHTKKTRKLSCTTKQILMKRQQPVKCKILYFTCIFINYYSIIDSSQHLLLFDKILSKTKTFITI